MRTHLRAIGALSIALALLSAGCNSGEPGGDEPGILRIVSPFELHSIVPAASSGVFTRLQVTETLVGTDMTGELTAGLSPAWSSSDDQTIWTFELPGEVTFHDGTPLTPVSVADSLTYAAAEPGSPLADAGIEDVRAVESGVEVTLAAPLPTLPATLTHYSTAILAPAAYDDSGAVVEVIGTGPYRVTHLELPASVHTAQFEQWRGAAPQVAQVEFQSVSRAESRALMAASDQADVVFSLEPAGRARVEAADGSRMVSSLQPRSLYLKVNGDHPVLGDVQVRRAISMAIDRAAIAEAALHERDLAATQLFPPSLPAWHQDDLEPLRHDPAAARTLLTDAGWTEGANGLAERDGTPLSVTLVTYPDRPELPALATAIQDQLRQVGIRLEVEVTNSSEIPAGHADGTLELGLLARHLALVSDPLVTVADTFSPAGSDWGVMNWQHADVLDAISGLLAGAADEEAAQLRADIARIAQEELPVIPVAWYRMNAAVSDRVTEFELDPLEHSWRITDIRWAA